VFDATACAARRRECGPEAEYGSPAPSLDAAAPAPSRPVARGSASRTHRKPLLLFRFDGSFLFRLETRRFLGLLFQEPPRNVQTAFHLLNTASLKIRCRSCIVLPWLACAIQASTRRCTSSQSIRPSP
jgi:hypothetical protein